MPAQPERDLRAALETSRRSGRTFDDAWDHAFDRGRIRWPHDTTERRMTKEVIQGTREAWRSAYERTPWPGSTGLRVLADLPATLTDARDVDLAGAVRGRPIEERHARKASR
jgi:hypothetical protein